MAYIRDQIRIGPLPCVKFGGEVISIFLSPCFGCGALVPVDENGHSVERDDHEATCTAPT